MYTAVRLPLPHVPVIVLIYGQSLAQITTRANDFPRSRKTVGIRGIGPLKRKTGFELEVKK